MIIPHTKLLIAFGLIGVPSLALIGAGIPHAWVLAVLLAAFVLVALADALAARGSLQEVALTFPVKLRATEECVTELTFQITQEAPQARTLLLAFAVPHPLSSLRDVEQVNLPGDIRTVALSWPIRAGRRGSYALREYYTGCQSPLGLWTLRRRHAFNLPVSVYPNLRSDRRGLAGVLLRGREGALLRRQLGQGREFEKLRDYIPGDSYADIHWKATARRARPATKQYQVERTQEVYVVLDTSRLSARPLADADGSVATALDHAITAAMMLGLVAQRQKDHFGLIAFADKLRRFVRAGSGLRHYHACRDALYNLEPQPVAVNFQEVATQIRLRLRKRALLIFLTSLDDPTLAEAFSRSMELISRQHLIIANILTPPDACPVFSNATVSDETDIYRSLAGHQQWHQLAELERSLRQRNVQLFQMKDAHMAVHLARQYLDIKQGQRL